MDLLDQFTMEIQNSSINYWTNPASNKKSAMLNKICELHDMIASNNFGAAYDKLLHDIKPKLTGLKTDENEAPWGNGVFNNPWVTCSTLQEIFRGACNQILIHVTKLINI